MADRPRKDCRRCGLTDAPFGFRKNRSDGLSPYCLMCMNDYRPQRDWSEVNRKRRSNPEYRQQERERSNLRDKERRLNDKNYVQRRYEDHLRYLQSGDAEAKAEAIRERRRQRTIRDRQAREASRTPENREAARKRQRIGFAIWNRRLNA